MEFSVNLADILKIVKKNIKIVAFFAIAFALLAAAYVLITGKNEEMSPEQTKVLAEQRKVYDNYINSMPQAQEILKKKLTVAYDMINENPVMKVDLNNVKCINLTFTIEDAGSVKRVDTFGSWINKLSSKSLFGKKDNKLSKYKREYVYTIGDIGEVNVVVLYSKLYDYKKVATKLNSYLLKKAKKEGVSVISNQMTETNGFSQLIADRQDWISNSAAKITNHLMTMQNYSMEQPSDGSNSGTIDIKKSAVLILAGMLFGILLGIVVVSFNVIRKGTVISVGQIENTFGLKRMTEGSINDPNYPTVIDAVIGAMSEMDGDILLSGVAENEKYERIAELISQVSERGYKYNKTTEDDVEVLKSLSKYSETVIPVTVGITTTKNVIDIIKWNQKFNKNILGYIVIEG